jgi:UDP-N-acetylmuramoyl-tripeptide--D-alanyl-D-alanine ligase
MMQLAEAAAALGGRTSGADVLLTGVSTDSRSLRAGDLFVALRGERFDGHDFLKAAAAASAAAAMVDAAYRGEYPLPALVVSDTRRSLGDLARYWRARFAPVLIAITGSNGKTTVKEMLAAILRRHAGEPAVLATRGNLNNDIGLPLTLLALRHATRARSPISRASRARRWRSSTTRSASIWSSCARSTTSPPRTPACTKLCLPTVSR